MAYRCIFSNVNDRPAVRRPHLTVIADVPGDVVGAAGGLICDRVRQGWRVHVHVPDGADTRALRVLGAAIAVDPPEEHRELRTALLTSVSLYARDHVVRSEVDCALATGTIEVLLWGPASGHDTERSVTHRLSGAAVAFKGHALLAADLPADSGNAQTTEVFVTVSAPDLGAGTAAAAACVT